VPLFQKLSEEWNKRSKNLDECGRLLANLKVKLTQGNLTFLPTQDSVATKQELVLARDVLEIGAQWSIEMKDVESFERYMAELKCYYLDYSEELTESAFKYQLLGLNLLRLLAQNKLADFHMELELLPAKIIQHNIYIKHPVSIEQYLMEGSYNKVFLARGNVPAANYKFFMDILLQTVRDEIASCLEKAYEKIGFAEAGRMLFFDTEQMTVNYAKERKWKLCPENANGMFYFQREEKVEESIPAIDLATRSIEYARELEMII
jgi:26S proteasome regulatory subunit N12